MEQLSRHRGTRASAKLALTRTILDYFDEWDRSTATRLYREFVAAGVGLTRSPWEDLRAKVYLGSEAFMAKVEELTTLRKRREHDSRLQRNVRAVDAATVERVIEATACSRLNPKKWSNETARLAFALLARSEAIATYSDIGSTLQLTPSGARQLSARARRLECTDRDFHTLIERCRLQISQFKKRV